MAGCLIWSPPRLLHWSDSLSHLHKWQQIDSITSSLWLFADDCVIYREIVTDDDYHIMQQNLLQLSSWSATWQKKFNVKKCAVLSITRKRSPRVYECNDAIPRAKEYLGVTVTTDLRWNLHWQNIRHKASRTLGLIRRTLSPCYKEFKARAYTALVRPGSGSGSGSVLHTTPWWAITVQCSRTFVAATIKFWSELCWPNYIRPCWTGLL